MNQINGIVKTITISVLIVVTVVTAIISSLSILKDEAVKTHLQIANLHAKTLSDQVTQTFNNIEILTLNLISVINEENEIKDINTKFDNILFNNPFLRSINILNETKNIIYSSNKHNTGLTIDTNDFYPKPMFDNSILRFGIPWIGRDFIDGTNVTFMESINKNDLSFIPILKHFSFKNRDFYILISINTDYILNRYFDNLNKDFAFIDIIRVDGILLFSSQKSLTPGSRFKETQLFVNSLMDSKSTGIETIDNKKFVASYQLTDIFPLNISVRIDLNSSLKEWEEKTSNISFLITALVIISALLVIALVFKYNFEKDQELKIQREQLKQKRKFHLLFDQSMFLAAIMKSDGSILEVNNVACTFMNKNISQLENIKFWDLSCWFEEEKKYLEELINNYKNGRRIHKELILKNYKDEIKTIEFSLMPLEFDGELELVALGLDITQRKKKEAQLRQAYTVFQNTHDGIMITDEKTNIININKAFIKSTGYSLEEVYNQTPRLLQSGMHKKEFYKDMWVCISQTGLWEGELINKKKNGTFYNEYITISAVYDELGNVKNYIGIFSDTTKQKEQELRLKEQERMLYQQSKMAAMGEMIENIAHQWRQPLSVISTISTGIIFKKEIGLSKKSEEISELEKINDSAQYLSQTIEDFRDFMRTDKPKSKFNLTTTIDRSINLISSKLKNKNIHINKDIQDIDILGIENELVQVFLNIINNSRDILEIKKQNDKVILISVRKEEQKAIIAIKDNGGGIEEDIIDRVFEPYFTTKHKAQGTGIGLYMTEEIIVKHMKGSIKCYNEDIILNDIPYKGACFEIELPIG